MFSDSEKNIINNKEKCYPVEVFSIDKRSWLELYLQLFCVDFDIENICEYVYVNIEGSPYAWPCAVYGIDTNNFIVRVCLTESRTPFNEELFVNIFEGQTGQAFVKPSEDDEDDGEYEIDIKLCSATAD